MIKKPSGTTVAIIALGVMAIAVSIFSIYETHSLRDEAIKNVKSECDSLRHQDLKQDCLDSFKK